METFSAVAGEFPAQRPVTRSFDVFFDLCLNKLCCVNNREAGDLRRQCAHYDITVMCLQTTKHHLGGTNFNKLKPEHKVANIFEWKLWYFTPLQCVSDGPIGNKSVFIKVMTWRRLGDTSSPGALLTKTFGHMSFKLYYNTPMRHFGPCVTFRPCQCDFSALRLFPASGTLPRD